MQYFRVAYSSGDVLGDDVGGKTDKRLNSASLQVYFRVAYSSGDVFIFFTLYDMTLYIHVLSTVRKANVQIFYIPFYVCCGKRSQ